MKPLNVLGLNSGTSMDGIDAALYRIEPVGGKGIDNGHLQLSTSLISSLVYPFEPGFHKRLTSLVASGQTTLEQLARLNFALGQIFADAALALIKQSGINREDVNLIGSHGQTLWHAPNKESFWGIETSASLQMAEPAVIAAQTKIPVVADFRVNDIAVGGQGAPLVAFADQILFGQEHVPTGVLNIGGIANITIIDSKGTALMAFDTGPGNMLIDRAAQTLFGREYDDGGKLAAAGKVFEPLLEELRSNPYLHKTPPKTTGREDFGFTFADQIIKKAISQDLAKEDCLATLTAFTASSIADAYQNFVKPKSTIERLVLGGGGAENHTLQKMILQYWPDKIQIHRHEDFGISTKFKEALLFALLAYTTYFDIPNNVPNCTGASRQVCLGKITKP
jgi:anhydro-N-acetylmuramic acid kinase